MSKISIACKAIGATVFATSAILTSLSLIGNKKIHNALESKCTEIDKLRETVFTKLEAQRNTGVETYARTQFEDLAFELESFNETIEKFRTTSDNALKACFKKYNCINSIAYKTTLKKVDAYLDVYKALFDNILSLLETNESENGYPYESNSEVIFDLNYNLEGTTLLMEGLIESDL